MKLIVSTFLVYKVKKCLLKSGKVTIMPSSDIAHPRAMFCQGDAEKMPWRRNKKCHPGSKSAKRSLHDKCEDEMDEMK